MKKIGLWLMLSWASLFAVLLGTTYYAKTAANRLEAPVVSLAFENGAAKLTWTAVKYATSYRVYSKAAGENWHQEQIVGSDTLEWRGAEPATKETMLAVRAVNASKNGFIFSDYAAAKPCAELPGGIDEEQ